MARIVIAAPSEDKGTQLSRLLTSSGYDIFRLCAAGGELRRAMSECGDGIALIWGGLAGVMIDEVAGDFSETFQFLFVGRPKALDACESPHIFKLASPCSGSAVIGAVEMLSQLHSMRLPHRTGGDRALVESAKQRLMQRYGIDEPEAHRRMQRYAMRHGLKMTEYAAMLLENSEGTEE